MTPLPPVGFAPALRPWRLPTLHRAAGLLAFISLWAAVAGARAQLAFPVLELEDGAVRVDGSLREWNGARFSELGAGPDGSMRWVVGYDSRGLYVAADVRDERIVRNREPGDGDDAIVLTLALPRGRGLVATEYWLHPGEPSRSAAVVTRGALGARRRAPLAGASIVEAPRPAGDGYTLEAFLPFAAIDAAGRWQEGRASIRLHDVDSLAHPVAENRPALVTVEPDHLDRLPPLRPTGGQGALLEEFLRERGVAGASPRYDLRGDVTGDAEAERVVLVDRFVVAFGPTIQRGRGYVFGQLGIESASDLREARLEDLTGDGKAELVVMLRQRSEGGSRDLFQVLRVDEQAIGPIWGLEMRKETSAGSVESTVRVERGRRGRPPTIVTAAGVARGLDASTFRETPPTDVEPIVLPWGPVLERSFRWDGRSFARVGERPNPRYVSPEDAAARERARDEQATTARERATPPSPPSLDAVVSEFLRQRGMATTTRPTRDLTANVADTAAPERILLFGRRLLIVGAEFRGGTGWFDYELPAASPEDVLDIRTVDLTGDGRHEIVLRIRQSLSGVRRDVLLVHQLTSTGFPSLLAREVLREQGPNRIENEVRIQAGSLEIAPGTARGWTQANWPYAPASGPGPDGVEPVSLPWSGRTIRYRFEGGRLRG